MCLHFLDKNTLNSSRIEVGSSSKIVLNQSILPTGFGG